MSLFDQTVSKSTKDNYDIREDITIFRAKVVGGMSVPQITKVLERVRVLLKKKDVILKERTKTAVQSRINRKLQQEKINVLHPDEDPVKVDKELVQLINESKDRELLKLLQKSEVTK